MDKTRGGPGKCFVRVTLRHSATGSPQKLTREMLLSQEGGGELGVVPALSSCCSLEHREMAGLPFTFLHAELVPMGALP